MLIRGKAKRFAAAAGVTGMAAAVAVLLPLSGFAGATAAVTAPGPSSNTAVGPFIDGNNITVSGTGFSTRASGNTIQILMCSDPGGLQSNLPVDNTTCDGTTINPNTVVPTTNGGFTDSYLISKLETGSGNAIDCDATNYCVLWVGEDYVNTFTGSSAQPVAFSAPFLVDEPPTPESPVTIALPIAAAGVAGGAGFMILRRRRSHSAAA